MVDSLIFSISSFKPSPGRMILVVRLQNGRGRSIISAHGFTPYKSPHLSTSSRRLRIARSISALRLIMPRSPDFDLTSDTHSSRNVSDEGKSVQTAELLARR